MAGNFNRRGRGGMNQREPKNQNLAGNRIEFRFLIPSRAASIIIGKGGERIQRLRHECNARLSIPDNHGPERVFILESTVENCIKVWRDYIFELKDCMFPNNADQRRAANAFREEAPDTDLRFLVHDSQAGVIIGKAGANVKNLRMQYQLNVIKVYPVTAPFSSDRVVQMVGKFDRIAECFRLIYESLEGQPIKGVEEKYNSANFDDSLAASYGGWGSQANYDGGMSNNQNSPNMRKQGSSMGGMGGQAGGDRNSQQGGRFNKSHPPNNNEQFYPKPDMNRPNMNAPQSKPMSRFDNFNPNNNNPGLMANNNENFAMDSFDNSTTGFEMDADSFQMPAFISSRNPMSMAASNQSQEQGFPGAKKRLNIDNEAENMKRGRFGGPPGQGMGGLIGNAPTFDNRNDKQQMQQTMPPHHYDSWGGEKPNFMESNRNEKPGFFDANRNDKQNFEVKWNEKPGFDPNRNEKQSFESKWNEKPNFDNKWNEKPNFDNKWNEKSNFESKWNEKPGSFDKWNEKPGGFDNDWNEKPGFDNKWNDKSGNFDNWNEKSGNFDNWNEKPSFEMNRNEKPGLNTNWNDTNKQPNFYDKQQHNLLGGRPDSGNMMPPAAPLMGNTNFGTGIDKVDVLVPSTLVHAIRGQNCVALSNIINDSGADVLINPSQMNEDDPNQDTTVTITGTKDQIEGAQYLLQICIKKSVLNL